MTRARVAQCRTRGIAPPPAHRVADRVAARPGCSPLPWLPLTCEAASGAKMQSSLESPGCSKNSIGEAASKQIIRVRTCWLK